jgi:poly(hydroxyalkanoate) granule-associated protein
MARAPRKSAKRAPVARPRRTLDVAGSAREIWLAGIGAMAVAEEESSKLFSTLVDKGSRYEAKNKARLDGVLDDLGSARTSLTGSIKEAGTSIRRSADRTLDRLEHSVDTGVASALQRLGVPTRKEIQALTRKVEQLTATLEARSGARRARPARKVVAEEPTAGAE